MGNHVFICHAREDKDFVLKLAANLKGRGVPVWLDQWDIPAAADWDQNIDDAIYDCAKFLIVLSPTAVASPEVRGELRTALDEHKPILPVVYQKCRIPRQLRTIQYVDFTSPGPQNEAVLEQVIRALAESKKAPSKEAEASEEATHPPVEREPEERKLIPPWIYGGIGVLVVLVIALFLHGQQQTKKTESVRPEIPVAETPQTPVAEAPVQEREEQKTAKSGQLKGRDRTEMVSIPAGDFWMGCNEKEDQSCDNDEKPGRKVSLDAYSIGKYEVTVAEYRRCVEP